MKDLKINFKEIVLLSKSFILYLLLFFLVYFYSTTKKDTQSYITRSTFETFAKIKKDARGDYKNHKKDYYYKMHQTWQLLRSHFCEKKKYTKLNRSRLTALETKKSRTTHTHVKNTYICMYLCRQRQSRHVSSFILFFARFGDIFLMFAAADVAAVRLF